MRFLPILVLLVGVGVAVGLSCVYIVDERQQALVLEFGKVKTIVNRPAAVETVDLSIQSSSGVRLATFQIAPTEATRGEEPAGPAIFGMSLADLTDEARAQFDIAAGVSGVVVTDVASGSPAAALDIGPGDVVVEIDQAVVPSAEEAVAAVDQALAVLLASRTVASDYDRQGIQEIQGPGLYFKLPAPFNTIAPFDKRILALETRDLEVTPLDNRRLVVNAFARWRVIDPLRFRESVQTEVGGEARLRDILTDGLREVLGRVTSDTILSADRASLMRQTRENSAPRAASIGVEIVDVRIRRADLPEQNLNATYERMQAERQQEAADERARGREAAQVRVAEAEREAVTLESEARRQAEVIRGEADAERNRIFAEAYGQDEEFFAFYRSLRAYETSLRGQNSTIVLSPDSQFFEYLDGDRTDN